MRRSANRTSNPATAAANCFSSKSQAFSGCHVSPCFSMRGAVLEALNTITRPKARITRMAMNIGQSVCRRAGMFALTPLRERLHQALEVPPALLVARVLIETGAGGRKQDHVAGHRARRRVLERRRHAAAMRDRDRQALEIG